MQEAVLACILCCKRSAPTLSYTSQDNPAFQAFEERRKKKYDKVIQGGVLMGSKGMDEGIDRNATRSP